MLYVDGELDPARQTDVQSRIDRDPTARNKVAALRLAGELVREREIDLGIADGIADAVMAKIAAGDLPAADKVAPIARQPQAQPANDNSRRIFYLAAAAVAAAAAFMIWGKTDTGPTVTPRPVAVETAPGPALPSPASAARGDDGPSPDGDLDTGVEVAAVDFGARQGSIFYVPSGAAEAHTTTVVWLADDSAGDE